MQFEGRVVLISGGGTGIGAATARAFAAQGANVALMGRRPEPVHAVAEEIGGLPLTGDAADPDAARRAVETAIELLGGLDVLIANAGGHGTGAALRTDDDTWEQALASNLTSAFLLARAALPTLIERGGSIVIVSSLAGVFAGPGVLGYTTAKHALVGLTRSLARDYGPLGVRVNVVCPGWVRTAMADEQMDALAAQHGLDRAEAYARVTENVPLRRPAEADEIASICLFLAGDGAAAMMGAVVMADGGASVVDLPTIAFAPPVTPDPGPAGT